MDVLIVDDSRSMRSIVQRTVRQAGYRSLVFGEACNGLEALEKVKADKPKLVISDWNMPEMTGIELLGSIQAQKLSVPFGFITSESSDEMRQLAFDSGAKFILAKPFTADDVQAALEPILGAL